MTDDEPQLLRFWGHLIPVIPSILCSIFMLHHLLYQRALHTAIHNHVIILMISFGLFYELTNIVWYLYFYLTGDVLSQTPVFCRIWIFIDAAVYVVIAMLMAWAAIERHILIFYRNWMATKTRRFFLHYLPMTICAVYPILFYGVTFLFMYCDVPLDYAAVTCSYYGCVSSNQSLGLWDSIMNFLLPIFLIVIFSISLLVRVVYHRFRVNGRIAWRNHRKLAIQILSISFIYFVFLLPPIVLNTAYVIGLPWDGGSDFFWAVNYLGYFTVLLAPFICILSLPELLLKCKPFIICQKQPTITTVSPMANR